MPKILITGATGFVGSHVLETLLTINHPDVEIVAACREPGRLLPAFRGEIRVGDLRDMAYQDRMLAGIDSVCHCAGWTSFLNHDQAMREYYLEPTLELINRIFEWRIKRFVNLSSIAAIGLNPHADDDTPGTPIRGCPIVNCLIAVEDYLKAQSNNYPVTSIINLRLGIYSGQRLGRGLLNTLLSSSHKGPVPYATGSRGYMPIVDGKDIGQAFARSALAPTPKGGYVSLNITGPEVPTQKEVMRFLRSQSPPAHKGRALPTPVYKLAIKTLGFWPNIRLGQLTRCQLAMLASPPVNANNASHLLGYDPEISWKATLLDTLADKPKRSSGAQLHDPVEQADVI